LDVSPTSLPASLPQRNLLNEKRNCHCEDPPAGGDEAIPLNIKLTLLVTRLPRSPNKQVRSQ